MRADIFMRRGEASFTAKERLDAYKVKGGPPTHRAPGGFVAGDLAELKKSILLCPGCNHKFDWKRHHYYPVWKFEKFPVVGDCDGCGDRTPVGRFYLHETNLHHAIVTKDEARRRRLSAVIL